MPQVEVKAAEADSPIGNSLQKRFEALTEAIRRRAYEMFEGRTRLHGNDVGDWLQAEQEVLAPMRCEVKQDGNSCQLQFSVPGFEGTDLQVFTVSDSVIVQGEKKTETSEKSGTTMEGRKVFYRYPVPENAIARNAKAEWKKDVLTVTIPLQVAVVPIEQPQPAPAAKSAAA